MQAQSALSINLIKTTNVVGAQNGGVAHVVAIREALALAPLSKRGILKQRISSRMKEVRSR